MTTKTTKITGIAIISFVIATLIHEIGHLIAAKILGFNATLSTLGFAKASVIVSGAMNPTELTIIASAGSFMLIITGIVLILSGFRIVGLVFVARSWFDMIPINGLDGHLIADASGYTIAISLLIIEIIIVSITIWVTLKSTK